MENPTEKLSLTEDRFSALAVASGSPSDSLEARNERLLRICKGWADAADASQQPETFYDGYSEAVMRAMQCMLTEAKARADYEYKKHKQLSQELETIERNITLCARYALGIRVEDGHEYFDGVRQTTYDVLDLARRHKKAMTLLKGIVTQYDAAPDGPLGAGFTNEPFLAAMDLLAYTAICHGRAQP
jgi:hypothetical protein